MGGSYKYKNSNEIWDEVREVAYRRFSGAGYIRLERHRKRGLQWPVHTEDTPILHQLDFRTEDGLGEFHYHQYKLRGMVEEIVCKNLTGYYLTTGRTMAMYNNAAQTKQTPSLMDRYSEDILLVHENDAHDFTSERVILKTEFGQTTPLSVKFTDKVEPKTLFVTFHHASSKINALFGDIDIIAIKDKVIHFVEVKSGLDYESAIQNITKTKLSRLIKTGYVYLKKNALNVDYMYDALIVT